MATRRRQSRLSQADELLDCSPPLRRVKVAIIGSGLAGLTAAYLLSTLRERADVRYEDVPLEHEVHIFEKVGSKSSPAPNPLN
jgi:NADPH-dependent glutamate synthase beta subunit-like oxidoreductase